MANFKVGQRVKVLGLEHGEATVTDVLEPIQDADQQYRVKLDSPIEYGDEFQFAESGLTRA